MSVAGCASKTWSQTVRGAPLPLTTPSRSIACQDPRTMVTSVVGLNPSARPRTLRTT
jgi:hypothetical protein